MNDATSRERQHVLEHLKGIAQEQGITDEFLAERCGWRTSSVERIMAGRFSPSLDQLIKLCQVIGVRITFSSIA